MTRLLLTISFLAISASTAFADYESGYEFQTQDSYFEMSSEFDAVIRGQSPDPYGASPYGAPPQGGTYYDPNAGVPGPGGNSIYGGATFDPYAPAPNTQGYDPFAGSGGYDPCNPCQPAPAQSYGGCGVVGPQPIRPGWTHRFNFVYIGQSDLPDVVNPAPPPATLDGGEVTVYEYEFGWDYVSQARNGWVWKLSPEFQYTNLNFSGVNFSDSDNYYRLSHRFQATSPQAGPLSYRFGFTPHLASDFDKSLNSSAWFFDGDITAFYRASPSVLWMAGVLYWDRADDYLLPTGGLIWTPNQFWEIRATYPEARADYFLGTPFGIPTWWYAGAKYDVQAWQNGDRGGRNQLEMSEWRAFTGFRWENGYSQSYLDFGYAFDRELDFHEVGVASRDPGDAFMIRYGITY